MTIRLMTSCLWKALEDMSLLPRLASLLCTRMT